MSIQAGWNQMLFTAGALGKLNEQNKLHEYNTVMNLQNKLQDKLGPIDEDFNASLRKSEADYYAAIEDVSKDATDLEAYKTQMTDMLKEHSKLFMSGLNEHVKQRNKAIEEFNFENAVDQMPRSTRKSYEKATGNYRELAKNRGMDFDRTAEARSDALVAATKERLAQAQMAAQRAQDAAQTADMQPKNSMNPILEQLRRNTQNAVKGGTK